MTSTPPIQPTAWGKMRSPSASQPAGAMVRPQVRGRFLFVGDEKLYLHGVTYGTFRPNESGDEYPPADRVNADFAQMAAHGINALRTYTVPPRWFLDLAERHGLRVMVGLPWEQHITFLDEQSQRRSIQERVRAGVRACAGHPAVLAFALGNEIPAPIVRWYGAAKIERFLLSLYRIAKAEDPEALVTYVNFPSTEYLDLPFVDFACFNVYLEQQDRLEAYLGRLHSLYHNKPLVMAEVGLDSDRNGLQRQAEVLSWQVASCFASGCSGLFVFAWTDEWHRGGYDVLDWAFGLTDRERRPKPALARVADAFTQTPFPDDVDWPRISVVVCTYNGSATLAECLDGLGRVDYPDYEVIVVNDGSTDRTAEIARRFECRVVDVENGGLSRARNIGMKAASGPIVAYIDDDAWPDPQWLRHLAWTFLHSDHVAVGGPNVPPLDDGFVAACVAHAPGSPTAVLLTDDLAEHIPGCNMAFWRDKLEAVGGFDARFRIAGDDVDVCWKLQERGGTIGYHPAAMVWHHRRRSIRTYLRQQRNYGRAEALLERKWPHKYNSLGYVSWGGQLYGNGTTVGPFHRGRIYHGVWGSAPFQPRYVDPPGFWRSLSHMPEWYMLTLLLLGATLCGLVWHPMLWLLPLLAVVVAVPCVEAWCSARPITASRPTTPRSHRLKLRLVTAMLHLLQPPIRLAGRVFSGLTPWRRWRYRRWCRPKRYQHTVWSEQWQSREARLTEFERAVQHVGPYPVRDNGHERWDLEVRGGMFGSVRLLMVTEEHGGGNQLVRLQSWPRVATGALALICGCGFACMFVGMMDWLVLAFVLGMVAVLASVRALGDCGEATAVCLDVLSTLRSPPSDPDAAAEPDDAAPVACEGQGV